MNEEIPQDMIPVYLALAHQVVEDAHSGQMRADGKTPYITHPIDVMNRVSARIAQATDPFYILTVKIAALAHDVLEDHPNFPLKPRLLGVGIGLPRSLVDRIMTIVDQLSNNDGDYLDYLLRLKDASHIVQMIKKDDFNSNIADIASILSKGRQKAMHTKYLLAHYILFGSKPTP